MGEHCVPTIDRLPVQTHALLIKQAARFTLAGRHFCREDYIQYGLARLECELRHFVRYLFLLEGFDKGVLCLLCFCPSIKDTGDLKCNFHLCITWMHPAG